MPKSEKGKSNLPTFGKLKVEALFGVEGKVCLVSGGGSGIGAMISAALVENGAKVYIMSRKDISLYAETLTSRGPGKCVSMRLDATDENAVEEFCNKFEDLEPLGVDILINNAGTLFYETIDKYPLDAWKKVFDLNTKSVFHMIQKMLVHLEKRATKDNPSKIINISSIADRTVSPMSYPYNASKAATTSLGEQLAVALAPRNITVNTICPGVFPSRMTQPLMKFSMENILKNIPLNRLGDIEDMAAIILYLCGPASKFVTGARFVVDGGQSLPRLVSNL